MRRALEVVGAIASIAALFITILVTRDLWDSLYPLPLILLLCVALVVCVTFFVRERQRVPADDQRRLDRILSTLPREAIRRIADADLSVSWSSDLLHPVSVFFNDLGFVEHEFRVKPLESARRKLYAAAGEFLIAADEGRDAEIGRTAHDFIQAHDAFVRVAKKRGFDLEALNPEVPTPRGPGSRLLPARNGSDGTRTRDLRRDRPAL
jgi:hypothetical protein